MTTTRPVIAANGIGPGAGKSARQRATERAFKLAREARKANRMRPCQ